MPSMSYRLRKYRLPLVFIGLFAAFLLYLRLETGPSYLAYRSPPHSPPVPPQQPQSPQLVPQQDFQQNVVNFTPDVGGSGSGSGSETNDMPKLPGDYKPPSYQKVPNLRFDNSDGLKPFNVDEFEILTSGAGSARVSDDGRPKHNLPSEKVPRPLKYQRQNQVTLPPPQKRIKLNKIQADNAPQENADARNKRLQRRQEVVQAMKISWNQYKKYAWGKDEVLPVSQEGQDPFLGWGATIVDGLDTLLVMGLMDEYYEAVNFIAKVDFSSTFRQTIPVFETTIRYLGGLLAAYDLNQAKDTVLLEQAKVLADNLIGTFDTHNGLPLTFFNWQHNETTKKYRAGTDSSFAEVGTLTLEFTRLAQLTGNNTYYDAVARVTSALHDFAPYTRIPWLFPTSLDVSGCNVSFDNSPGALNNPVQIPQAQQNLNQQPHVPYHELSKHGKRSPTDEEIREMTSALGLEERSPAPSKDETPVLVPTGRGDYRKGFCTPKGVTTGAHAFPQTYTFGGLADSAYEYFGKVYQLLGGSEPTYQHLYENMVNPAKEHIVYRPKVDTAEQILFLGNKQIRSDGIAQRTYEMQHLTCFAGGMFALGGKLFNRPEDVDLGAKITRGCIWAYNATRTGVMPELFSVEACEGGLDFSKECKFENPDVGKNVHNEAQFHHEIEQVGEAGIGYKGSQPGTRPDGVNRISDENGIVRRQAPGKYDQPPSFLGMEPRYLMRPEAIESVFYMHRITGDPYWQEHGYNMFKSIVNLTQVRNPATGEIQGFSSVADVTNNENIRYLDNCESFWVGETLKYSFLLFDEFDHISLDDYVFNTEAHPFRVDKT